LVFFGKRPFSSADEFSVAFFFPPRGEGLPLSDSRLRSVLFFSKKKSFFFSRGRHAYLSAIFFSFPCRKKKTFPFFSRRGLLKSFFFLFSPFSRAFFLQPAPRQLFSLFSVPPSRGGPRFFFFLCRRFAAPLFFFSPTLSFFSSLSAEKGSFSFFFVVLSAFPAPFSPGCRQTYLEGLFPLFRPPFTETSLPAVDGEDGSFSSETRE